LFLAFITGQNSAPLMGPPADDSPWRACAFWSAAMIRRFGFTGLENTADSELFPV
jgi:hypothetical protein